VSASKDTQTRANAAYSTLLSIGASLTDKNLARFGDQRRVVGSVLAPVKSLVAVDGDGKIIVRLLLGCHSVVLSIG